MLTSIPLPLIILILLFAFAVGSIAWVIIVNRQRRAVVQRAMGGGEYVAPVAIRPVLRRSPWQSLVDWLGARVPAQLGVGTVNASQLVHAGFEGPAAGPVFALLRIASAILFTTLAVVFAPRGDSVTFAAVLVIGVAVGLLAPTMLLNRLVEARQTKFRRAIPDALDLLVVCVEAGVALDAGIQRVAREMYLLHPLLSEELLGMSRRISAGMPREQAMHGLYIRTGVDELRSLASHMLQSERWGTSIATVLRLYSEQLRHKRRVAAEKRAATASTRMLIPLTLFIFPTLFVVLLGPAVMRIATMF
jgi:tight adherence protein C